MKGYRLTRSVLSVDDDVASAATSMLSKLLEGFLEDFRRAREKVRILEKELKKVEEKLRRCETQIAGINREIGDLKRERNLTLLVALALGGAGVFMLPYGPPFVAIIALALVLMGYAYSLHNRAAGSERLLRSLRDELSGLKRSRDEVANRLEAAKRELASIKPPKALVSAYRAYVPIGLVRVPGGDGYLVITPWSGYQSFAVSIVADEERLQQGIERISEGEEAYVGAVVRERATGYEVVEGLRSLGAWEKVLASRSPEELLREIAAEGVSAVFDSVEEREARVRLERLDPGSAELLRHVFSTSGALEPVEDVVGELRRYGGVLEEDFRDVEVLLRAAETLRGLSRYLREARVLQEKCEVYRSVIEEAVRKAVEVTLPVDREVYALQHSAVFCRKCADSLKHSYVSAVDLQAWVFRNVLAGVDNDLDIKAPDPFVKDVVEKMWRRILERSYRELPLPGVDRSAPLEEMEKQYRSALEVFALPFTGADEGLELLPSSPFEEARLRCSKCGSPLGEGDAYGCPKLYLPVIKGYAALLSESVDTLYKKAELQRKSVNDARRSKDERKTMVGIYKQAVHSYARAKAEAEAELQRVKAYLTALKAHIVPLAAELASSRVSFGKVSRVLKKVVEE